MIQYHQSHVCLTISVLYGEAADWLCWIDNWYRLILISGPLTWIKLKSYHGRLCDISKYSIVVERDFYSLYLRVCILKYRRTIDLALIWNSACFQLFESRLPPKCCAVEVLSKVLSKVEQSFILLREISEGECRLHDVRINTKPTNTKKIIKTIPGR